MAKFRMLKEIGVCIKSRPRTYVSGSVSNCTANKRLKLVLT